MDAPLFVYNIVISAGRLFLTFSWNIVLKFLKFKDPVLFS